MGNRDHLRIEDMACVLLLRLMDHTSGDVSSPVLPADISAGDPSQDRKIEMMVAIELLAERGLVEVVRKYYSAPERIQLTWAGKRRAKELEADRQAPGALLAHTVERMIRAAFREELDYWGISKFTKDLLFQGSDLDKSNYYSPIVEQAGQYLMGHGLADFVVVKETIEVRDIGYAWWNRRMRNMEITKLKKLKLTVRGIDCVMAGVSVREYMAMQNSAGAGPVFNQNVYGGAAVQGVHVTQNVGIQPGELVDLVHKLRDVATQFPPVEREKFLNDVEVLGNNGQSSRDRISAGQRIKAALVSASSRIGGQAIIAAVEKFTNWVADQ
ncbi:hypothetical protein [Streptomyces bohaiensis]|uniref:AbiTii domain-containing protein n=1 Tax=Streptomyces bohaiensis TaxID=1431344 RepID=A0ABX1CB06_9ACTN|nr:hypothetical protein [Streptomyces bohaiensis]NJQ13489.1 hypothetical protein [Streptomyces bohaiensis]